MSTYARIEGGLVVELFTTDENIAELFEPGLVWMDVTDLDPAPQEGWHFRAPDIFSGPTPMSEADMLAAEQEERIVHLRASCRSQIIGGFESSALGTPHIYPSDNAADQPDQLNLQVSVLASLLPGLSEDWTTVFLCRDEEGVWAMVPHTAAQIQQVGIDAKTLITAARMRFFDLSNEVAEATTIDAVHAINW